MIPSSTQRLELFYIYTYKKMINVPMPSDMIDMDVESKRHLYVAAAVIGIFSFFVYKKLSLSAAACCAVYGVSILVIATGGSLVRELLKLKLKTRRTFLNENDNIQQLNSIIFEAMRVETYFKQQALLHVFKDLPNDAAEKNIQEAVTLYALFYDKGEKHLAELNNKMKAIKLPEITPHRTISMNNYTQLLDLADCVLASKDCQAPSTTFHPLIAEKLPELRNQCALLIYGQDYKEDGYYDSQYMQLVGKKLRPWNNKGVFLFPEK